MKSLFTTFPLFTSKRLSLFGVVAVLLISGACGSDSVTPALHLIGVSVMPVSMTVSPGDTQQLTAMVINSADTAVVWSTTFGAISATGLLSTPPATADMTFRVTATSKADRRRSAYSLITVKRLPSSFSLAPASVTSLARQGATDPTPVSVLVTMSGGGTFTFTARTDQPWLMVSPVSGVGPETIQVQPSVTGLVAGTYTGHIIFTGSDKSAATATVSLIVSKLVTEPRATISWNASKSNDVVSYRVYRSAMKGGPYGMEASALDRLTYSDLTVQSGQTYYYVATAVDDSGRESAFSTELKLLMP